MVVDELDHPGSFPRRSSSAWAKYADAFRRIAFARVSSRTSRSNSFNRSRAAGDPDGRGPCPFLAVRRGLLPAESKQDIVVRESPDGEVGVPNCIENKGRALFH